MKFGIGEFYEKLSNHFSFPLEPSIFATTSHEDLFACLCV